MFINSKNGNQCSFFKHLLSKPQHSHREIGEKIIFSPIFVKKENMETYNCNYIQEVPQTDSDKIAHYLTLSKEKLAQMLVEANKQLQLAQKMIPPYSHNNEKCTSWAECRNPHHDCLNCPFRFFSPTSPNLYEQVATMTSISASEQLAAR